MFTIRSSSADGAVRLAIHRLRHAALLGAKLGGGGGGEGQGGEEENEAHGLHSLVHGSRVKPCALGEERRFAMTDPRRPRGKEAQLPDALDQTPSGATPRDAEAHGSEDAQLLAGIDLAREGEGDVEQVDGRPND